MFILRTHCSFSYTWLEQNWLECWKSDRCEEGGTHLFWYFVIKLKNNSLLKQLLKWSGPIKNVANLILTMLFLKENKEFFQNKKKSPGRIYMYIYIYIYIYQFHSVTRYMYIYITWQTEIGIFVLPFALLPP